MAELSAVKPAGAGLKAALDSGFQGFYRLECHAGGYNVATRAPTTGRLRTMRQLSARRPPATFAELVSAACLMLSLPGGVLYAVAVLLVASGSIDLTGQLLPAMLLAVTGLGLLAIAVVGIAAGTLHARRQRGIRGLNAVSLAVNAGIVAGMLGLWYSGWQVG